MVIDCGTTQTSFITCVPGTETCSVNGPLSCDATTGFVPETVPSAARITECAVVNGDVRVIPEEPRTPFASRLEFFHNGAYGNVCDGLFGSDNNGAIVACRQQGFHFGTPLAAQFVVDGGANSQAIFLDNVACFGIESRIEDCSSLPIGGHNCSRSEDVGVTCFNTP